MDPLLNLLKEKAYRKGEFKLSSGKTSEHYVNCKSVILSGEGLKLTSEALLKVIKTKVVGGLTLGADPLVCGVGVLGGLDQKIVRKEPKGHGTSAWIEGPDHPVDTEITVLEDVITTGGSAIFAVEKLRDAGYYVKEVVSIIDRKEYDPFTFLDKELELISLYTLDQLI